MPVRTPVAMQPILAYIFYFLGAVAAWGIVCFVSIPTFWFIDIFAPFYPKITLALDRIEQVMTLDFLGGIGMSASSFGNSYNILLFFSVIFMLLILEAIYMISIGQKSIFFYLGDIRYT